MRSETMHALRRVAAISLFLALSLALASPTALARSSLQEADSTLVGRFVIKNIYGWGGIPGGRLTRDIYVTIYHPRSGKSYELVTGGKGYVSLKNLPPGIYVLKEITYVGESVVESSRLTAPLTPLTCDAAPSSVTYCGTVVYTFRRLPEGRKAYVGRVRPEKHGLHGLDILDETEAARKAFAGGEGGPAFRTSLWMGPKGLPTWEAAVHFLRGYEHAQARRYEKAVPEFKAGLESDPEHAWAHYMLSRAYQWQERDEEAIAEYAEAFRLQPDFAWAHHSLGILYLLRAQYGLAREEFQKAAAIDPAFVSSAYYHLKKLERIAKVDGIDLDAYKPRNPEEESFMADAKAAIDAAFKMDWGKCFSYFSDEARIEAHCGMCDPSKFFSIDELKDYLSQPIAKNYRIHHVRVRLLSFDVSGSQAHVTFFSSYELAKVNEEKGWWFADISTVRAKKAGERWVLTEHQYTEHLH